MLQILIVDDEIHAVDGIRSGVDWQKLGITAVFTALTVKQAKELFESERIDIMLCDIEMPQATGLELTAWVKERYPKTETIFLTCHADFKYAKEALRLGGLDYILKPIPFVELEKVIFKAIEKINKDTELSAFSQYGKFWFKNQPMLIERFWIDILNQSISPSAESISRAAADRNIPYDERMSFVPVLISLQRWHKPLTLREEKILEFALKNSAEEIILGPPKDGQLIAMGNGRLLAILSAESYSDIEKSLKQSCERYIDACRQYFYCDLSCYIGGIVHGHEMFAMTGRLMELENNNVAYNNRVFLQSDIQTSSAIDQLPDMLVWSTMMKEGEGKTVLEEATRYLDRMLRKHVLHAKFLRQFHQDFQQMLYYSLQMNGIQAHQLFSDNRSLELSSAANRSVTDLISWMHDAVSKALEYANSVGQSQSVVERVKSYIKQHISEDLSREDIANYVFLNPDYLTRIFKKETGMAVSDYLLQERLKFAKELLTKTDMPIGAIASHIGYANFSHFSRMFKKYTDLNPIEYRQTHQSSRVE